MVTVGGAGYKSRKTRSFAPASQGISYHSWENHTGVGLQCLQSDIVANRAPEVHILRINGISVPSLKDSPAVSHRSALPHMSEYGQSTDNLLQVSDKGAHESLKLLKFRANHMHDFQVTGYLHSHKLKLGNRC